MDSPDVRLAALAQLQHGCFRLDQVLACGFTVAQVRTRMDRGQWWRPMRGLVAITAWPDSWERQGAIALVARPEGALGELTAARLLGLVDSSPQRPVLLVPPGASGRTPVADVRRADLALDATTVVRGLRCTDASRTLLDLAGSVGPKRLRAMVDRALHLRPESARALARAVDRAPRLDPEGRAALTAAIDVWLPAIRPGSIAEARLLRQISQWDLPTPERQVVVRDEGGAAIARLDAGWPACRLGLEYDSRRWHGPGRWSVDEARHAALHRLGWEVLHLDSLDLRPGSDLRQRLEAAHRTAMARAAVSR